MDVIAELGSDGVGPVDATYGAPSVVDGELRTYHWVEDYTRADGTIVTGHWKSRPG